MDEQPTVSAQIETVFNRLKFEHLPTLRQGILTRDVHRVLEQDVLALEQLVLLQRTMIDATAPSVVPAPEPLPDDAPAKKGKKGDA